MKNLTQLFAILAILTFSHVASAQFTNPARMATYASGTPLDRVNIKTCGGLSLDEYRSVFDYVANNQRMPKPINKKLNECIEKKKNNNGRLLEVSKRSGTLHLFKSPYLTYGPAHRDETGFTLVQLNILGGAKINLAYVINQDLSVEGYIVRINRKGEVVNRAYIFGDALETRD